VATFVGRSNVLAGEAIGERAGSQVHVRPEALRFAADGPLHGTVEARRFAGGYAYFTVRLAGDARVEVFAPHDAVKVGDTVRLAVDRVLLRS
jgi:ABC-type Fe3+/spermidine/putrescine transport system ATPase subunit